MKVLLMNNDGNNKAYFINPKKKREKEDLKPIETITKEDIFDIITYMIDNSVELDEYKEGLLQNPAQDTIYKSLYNNFKNVIDNKNLIINEIDLKFKLAEEKYIKK